LTTLRWALMYGAHWGPLRCQKLSKAVTRAELYEAVYQKVGLSRTGSSAFVELVLKEITDCLEKGETVKLSSFGSFMVREKGRRVGRNPKTGIEVMISPRRVVVFKPSAIMKQQINSQPPGSGAGAGAEIVRCGPASASKLPRDINSWTAHSPPSNQRNGPSSGGG
jgi:integration host factor subunit alpha